MKKVAVPNRRAGNDKYGIQSIKTFKDFPIVGLTKKKLKSYYDKIRQSACYYSNDEQSFSTRKMENDNGEPVIRVYRN